MREKLKVGDKIMLYHMEDEFLSPGTKGVVKSISIDPFEDDGLIIEVNWENGSNLSMLSKVDVWKKLEESTITESKKPQSKTQFIETNDYIFKNFDYKAIRSFLLDIRDSGVTNMYGSSPLLYSGSDYIVKKFGSPYDIDFEDNKSFEAYERVVENADIIKNKLIDGVMKTLASRGEDFDLRKVQMEVEKASRKLLSMYMVFF